MQTYRVIGAPHYVSHWNSDGFEISIKFDVGTLVNSEQDLPLIYRGKFEIAPYDPLVLNIDLLHNPPSPPKSGCCCGGGGNGGGGGSISFDVSSIPEHYFFVDDIARDDYFDDHASELQKDVMVVSGGHLQVYNGTAWVYLALTVSGENATINIAETITGEPGTDANVENLGTETNAILRFTVPRGATGEPGSAAINAVTATPISVHRLVTFDDSGKIIIADFEHPQVIGLTMQAAAEAGTSVSVLLFGVVQDLGWDFNPLDPIVLDDNGRPVQANVSTFPVVTRVGKAVTATSFLLDIELPIG
jgi:hypothetical protein